MELSVLYFILYIHSEPIGFDPAGKSTGTYVLLDNNESLSSFIASFQKEESLEAIGFIFNIQHNGYFV